LNTLHLAGVIRESIVDGPGIRYTVFAQGCPHHCEGCHNPHTWPFEGGYEAAPRDIVADMRENPMLKGVTLSGGEPFCQCAAMAELARLAHQAGYDVIAYTGYLFEDLLRRAHAEPDVMALLNETDYLVDGPFIQRLKSYDLRFRGSSNQRAIKVRESMDGKLVIAEL